jgi:hypothetical protein
VNLDLLACVRVIEAGSARWLLRVGIAAALSIMLPASVPGHVSTSSNIMLVANVGTTNTAGTYTACAAGAAR